MEEMYQPQLNPWFSIRTSPRATIQPIVETDPRRLVLLLAALGGISTVLDRASMRSLGDKLDRRAGQRAAYPRRHGLVQRAGNPGAAALM